MKTIEEILNENEMIIDASTSRPWIDVTEDDIFDRYYTIMTPEQEAPVIMCQSVIEPEDMKFICHSRTAFDNANQALKIATECLTASKSTASKQALHQISLILNGVE